MKRPIRHSDQTSKAGRDLGPGLLFEGMAPEEIGNYIAELLNGTDEDRRPFRQEVEELINLFHAAERVPEDEWEKQNPTTGEWEKNPTFTELLKRVQSYRFYPTLLDSWSRSRRSIKFRLSTLPDIEIVSPDDDGSDGKPAYRQRADVPYLQPVTQVKLSTFIKIGRYHAKRLGSTMEAKGPQPDWWDRSVGMRGFGWWWTWPLLLLVEKQMLNRLRRCQLERCNRWYFARREDQHWCSKKCRQKHYLSTPEGRKKWNAYMAKKMKERYHKYESKAAARRNAH
jgi:hypothetical protein